MSDSDSLGTREKQGGARNPRAVRDPISSGDWLVWGHPHVGAGTQPLQDDSGHVPALAERTFLFVHRPSFPGA
ncbi:hypothetical protein IscW_ISCW016464 [Ixodes scapularis]|uniref:Uncharacterized protein n=1 Tax=Ixodes scapularis TaxID=6945 RepID=B7P3F2_IXOSC|nr:hypothetical protein IscW_ISCW016464 [Ixodes scapularis]|eukprot:XP_002404080.1 hypothetical protein IscW_ISCW016464 [Ixodes scapularis]